MDILEFHDDDADMGSDPYVESVTDLIAIDDDLQWTDFDFADAEDMGLDANHSPDEVPKVCLRQACDDLQKQEEDNESQEDPVTDHDSDEDEPQVYPHLSSTSSDWSLVPSPLLTSKAWL